MSPEVLDDIRNLLYAGYHTENVDMSGADGPAKFLRSKNHKYLPDDVVKRCDDQVRKQIENEGGSPTNPVRRNGYRRTLQAEPEEVLDSVLTRRRTTDTRRARDRQQARNLQPKLTNPVAQAVVDAQLKTEAIAEKAQSDTQSALDELFRTVYDATRKAT